MEHESNTTDRGPWMLTRLGYQFYPLSPKPEDFRVFEISAALSKTCRYNGQCPQFYTVAEHCVHLANHFLAKNEIENAKWAWAHDGAEAYIGDMIRPIKWLFEDFKKIEKSIENVYFHEVLKLEGECPKTVMDADTLICNDERNQLWANVYNEDKYVPEKYGHNKSQKLGITVQCWNPDVAEYMFNNMYFRLF
jgi:hypothetical protein